MDRTRRFVVSEQQAAVTTRVLGVVLDDITVEDDSPDIGSRDHAVEAGHLADGVRQEQNAPGRRGADHPEDVSRHAGHPLLRMDLTSQKARGSSLPG